METATTDSTKLVAGAPMPAITLPKAGGDHLRLGGGSDKWQMLVVYRYPIRGTAG